MVCLKPMAVKPSDIIKMRSTIKSFYREWSQEVNLDFNSDRGRKRGSSVFSPSLKRWNRISKGLWKKTAAKELVFCILDVEWADSYLSLPWKVTNHKGMNLHTSCFWHRISFWTKQNRKIKWKFTPSSTTSATWRRKNRLSLRSKSQTSAPVKSIFTLHRRSDDQRQGIRFQHGSWRIHRGILFIDRSVGLRGHVFLPRHRPQRVRVHRVHCQDTQERGPLGQHWAFALALLRTARWDLAWGFVGGDWEGDSSIWVWIQEERVEGMRIHSR